MRNISKEDTLVMVAMIRKAINGLRNSQNCAYPPSDDADMAYQGATLGEIYRLALYLHDEGY